MNYKQTYREFFRFDTYSFLTLLLFETQAFQAHAVMLCFQETQQLQSALAEGYQTHTP